MTLLNTSADISGYFNTIYEDAMWVAQDNNIMTTLVKVFSDRQDEETRKSSEYPTVTINSIAESDDLVGQSFTPAVGQSLTPAGFGSQIFLTDRRLRSDPFHAREDATTALGMAMALKFETLLLSDFTSLTGGTIGNAGSAFSWGYVSAMLTNLRAQNAPLPYYLVCHPNQWHVLAKAASVAASSVVNGPAMQDAVNSRWFMQRWGPVDIYTSTNCTTSGGTAAYAAMFTRDALALDIRQAMKIEPERDASRRGWELNVTAEFAHGIWRPTFGVQGIFDNSLPTN